jgi:hypothetical protein
MKLTLPYSYGGRGTRNKFVEPTDMAAVSSCSASLRRRIAAESFRLGLRPPPPFLPFLALYGSAPIGTALPDADDDAIDHGDDEG